MNRSVVLLIALLFGGCIRGGNYYLSVSGNDKDDGSAQKPWKTIERLNQVDLNPGDTVFFAGGETFIGTVLVDSADKGIANRPVLFASYGEGRAIIDGGNSASFQAANSEFLRVENLIFKGAGRKSGNTSNGIFFDNCSNIQVLQVEVSGFQHSGLQVIKGKDIRIAGVHAHDNGFAGIHVSGSTINDPVNYDNQNIYIGYSVAENNPGDPTITDNHSGNGILVSSVDGGVIEYCEAFNNGWDMPWNGNGPVGIWIWDANGFIIQHCIAHHNKTAKGAHDGGGFDFDGGVSNSIMQYNLSFENEGPGIGLFEFGAAKPWHDNTVRYNLSVNDSHTTKGGLRIWRAEGKGKMHDCDIYNNTIYSANPDSYGIGLLTNEPGMRFYNNIFVYDKDFLPEEHTINGEKFLNNLYWQLNEEPKFMKYASMQDWAVATGNETENGKVIGLQIDPLLISPVSSTLPNEPTIINPDNLGGFYLSAQSPAIDTGLDLGGQFSLEPEGQDLAGNEIPMGGAIDVGALEFLE